MTYEDAPIRYGAVYFRKSNPPREDWEQDYAQASADGMNTFRHWFMWSAVEVAPGVYDWSDYDRQLDLAAEYGIRTIIAEHVTFAPEWAYHKFAGCELRTKTGQKAASTVNPSSAIAGAPGLCLDHLPVRAAAANFLRSLADRYKDHPGLGGYDLWNECNIPEAYCYCDATATEFRRWLRERYTSLRALGEAWRRYSFSSWDEVHPPVDTVGYAAALDWVQFRIDHAYERLRWRARLIRDVDPAHPITAHGIAASLTQMGQNAADDWRAASEVDSYGFTWVTARKGGEPWKQWNAVDLVRSASRGKPFWHAEMQGGPLWLQPQVLDRPRSDGRIPTPEDIRLWNFVSLAGGVRGIQYLRWRPLLDGPLFGAFGPYSMSGKPTPRSEMASRIARWANAHAQSPLWTARPVRGEVGILVVPESQFMISLLHGEPTRYTHDIWGVYRGFFDQNIQADFVRPEDVAQYDRLYLPLPVMLTRHTAERVCEWVAAGGTLISEGCPSYFSDHGRACPQQPGAGLDALFGAREDAVEFTPDLLERGIDEFVMGGEAVRCGVVRQSYEPTDGRAVGWYDDGNVAAVEHHLGRGRTLLVGTGVGEGYFRSEGRQGRGWFGSLLHWASIDPHVSLSEAAVTARIHQSNDGVALWVTNPDRLPRDVRMRISRAWGPFQTAEVHWGDGQSVSVRGNDVTMRVPPQDAVICRLS